MIDARKISELPETNIMKDSSCMPIAQDGETKKIYFSDLKWLFKGDKGEPGEKGEKGDTGVSIDRITVEESDVDEGKNKITILKDNGQAVTFIIRNGSKGVTMRNRGTWESGVEYENGVTYLDIVYYPETGCSYVCNTSHTSGAILPTDTNYWTLLSLRGEKGDKGEKGDTGDDGISCTHSWNGTTLSVTSASGTSSANLKGDKGDKGDKGEKGDIGEQGPKGDTGAVATVVQNTGASLDDVMSQKAVSDELSKLKSDLDGKTRVNLLNPTLENTTLNGITCTYNGDGTYTVNGTASAECVFEVLGEYVIPFPTGDYKVLGAPSNSSEATYLLGGRLVHKAYYDGKVVNIVKDTEYINNTVCIVIRSGVTVNNVLFKPMITDDLSATYDDFVSWEDSNTKNNQILSYEEIQASTDLRGKVASASAVKDISEVKEYNVTIDSGTLLFRKVGKVVRLYASLSNMSSNETTISVTIPIDLSPKNNYSIINVYNYDSPYTIVGTAWVYTSGRIDIFKPINLKNCYIYGTYLIE